MNWSALRTVLPPWFFNDEPTTCAQWKVIYQAGDQAAIDRLKEKKA